MARKKPTQKEILAHFFATFFENETLTKSQYNSQYKFQAIKLKNLKGVVKEYLEQSEIETDKSVEQIIMDAITYAGMSGCKFKSIASIGYDTLPKSIEYWKRMELKMQKLEEEAKKKEKEKELASELDKKVAESNKRMADTRKVPSWLQLEDE